jgi:hypothetical protein
MKQPSSYLKIPACLGGKGILLWRIEDDWHFRQILLTAPIASKLVISQIHPPIRVSPSKIEDVAADHALTEHRSPYFAHMLDKRPEAEQKHELKKWRVGREERAEGKILLSGVH